MVSRITICLGSSCFVRGNREHLRMIEAFLEETGAEATVDFRGSRCEGRCTQGPNITIDGTVYGNLDEGTLMELLRRHFPAHEEPLP